MSDKLRESWTRQGIVYEERRVDLEQKWLDELLEFSDVSPTIVYTDGRIEIGFEGEAG